MLKSLVGVSLLSNFGKVGLWSKVTKRPPRFFSSKTQNILSFWILIKLNLGGLGVSLALVPGSLLREG